jgi:hypothetical protein
MEQHVRIERLTVEGRTLMPIGRPIPPLLLTDEERETLERWMRRPTTAQALAQRARVILVAPPGRRIRAWRASSG